MVKVYLRKDWPSSGTDRIQRFLLDKLYGTARAASYCLSTRPSLSYLLTLKDYTCFFSQENSSFYGKIISWMDDYEDDYSSFAAFSAENQAWSTSSLSLTVKYWQWQMPSKFLPSGIFATDY